MMLGLSNEDYRDLVLSVGTHRKSRRLSPLEVAQLLAKAVATGVTRQDCATELRIGVTQVRTFLRLLDLDSQIQHLADWRGTKKATIPFSTLAELARLSTSEQVLAADAVLRHNLTWKEVVQLVQIVERSGKAISDCIDDVLNLRPEIVSRHLFIGAVTSEHMKSQIQNIAQNERDELLSRALARLFGSNYRVEGRLGSDSFTILSDHNVSHLLGTQPDEFEQEVNHLLENLRLSK